MTSICTVLLLTPNSFAAVRTVALFSIMYSASSHARSSMFVFKNTTPTFFYRYHIYAEKQKSRSAKTFMLFALK